jgi:NTP pyrophosphatase (non-canonical NTP hydrolase)
MLNELAKECYEIATSKGWHDTPVAFGDALMNIHAEISEAWECYRKGMRLEVVYDDNGKPEGIPVEIADVFIRLLDTCHMCSIDIDAAVRMKMEHNKTRDYRHGGKIV